jgi:hypothetical protein
MLQKIFFQKCNAFLPKMCLNEYEDLNYYNFIQLYKSTNATFAKKKRIS